MSPEFWCVGLDGVRTILVYTYNTIAYIHIFIHIYDRYTMMYSVYTADTRMCNCVSLPLVPLNISERKWREYWKCWVFTPAYFVGILYRISLWPKPRLEFEVLPTSSRRACSRPICNFLGSSQLSLETSKIEAQLAEMSSNWAYWRIGHIEVASRLPHIQTQVANYAPRHL